MEISETETAKVKLTASGGIDGDLLDAFAEEGIEVDGVWGEIKKSAGIELDIAHYIVDLLLQGESNVVAAVEGAGALLVLQRVSRAIKRVKARNPGAQGELSVERGSKRQLNYVLPDDPEELRLALEALPDDMAKSTPSVEKWWRHGHGWLTAEEGGRLDGYTK